MPSISDELFSPASSSSASSRQPSTPATGFIISPTTRRHHSRLSHQSPSLSNVPVNDDDKERRQRRQSKVLEMQRGLQSPVVTPGDKRRLSIGSGGFTNSQVIEHYANCIKLSAENKINAKNAFSLNLIDHMSDLIKQKERSGGMTNFQVASCTLDASAKIYAGRVDSIHADTYKMLGGLGRDNEKPSQDGSAVGDENDDGTTKKKKQKRTKKSKIESNLKNIKRKELEMDFEVDPLFKQMSSEFDAGGSSGLLLSNLGQRDDSCEVMLDTQSIVDIVSSPHSQDENSNMVDLSNLRGIYKSLNLESTKICPEFSGFEFSNWDGSDESQISSFVTDPAKNEQAFDVNAVPEPIEEMPAEDGMPDFGGGGDFSDDDEAGSLASDLTDRTVMLADGKEARPIHDKEELGKVYQRVITDGTMGQLCLLIAQEQTDFSYFNLDMLKTWAGPKHWKMKAKSKDLAANKNDARKKSKKPSFELNYAEEGNFDKFFKVTKASTTLTKGTVEKWSESNTTLPEDLDYNPDKLFSLFVKTNIMLKRQVQSNSEGLDDGIDNYNYENENDCNNFCPGVQEDDNDDDDADIDNNFSAGGMDFSTGDSEFSQSLASQNHFGDSLLESTQLQGDHLVAQPHKVAKIDIQYAKTAKKMDVKRLKSSMWNLLTTKEDTEKENIQSEESPEKSTVAGTQSFKQMYGALPAKISTNMAKNLSIPMCFVCLLHLANEKNLKIDGVETFGDLLISQDG
ncbi:condensin complex subunit 2-like [Ptychodera flava]|uniref:condensin complex subunit 2-like n=1 Tax=Ptychodera flava TaxID=63121 RepID=UPI00396A3B34